ncbi:MAG: hypothetical protein AMQ74_01406 [Candidatus Methanofastidiosum methylothiophilum]|uniref:Uncharacterized protein n=1 Tax=Candidatus Methanofastidiosum methylothiophilum TaxID=1705564 RepID=A0A150IXG5_9EURY|nr:MAG: hypothetical protein AMQ74_01406 [Candidatus Methanofastidiosum methylthiophilus]
MPPKSPNCPECGSEKTVVIIYGIPGQGLLTNSKKSEFIIGGCEKSPDAPIYHCKRCKNEWGKLIDQPKYL